MPTPPLTASDSMGSLCERTVTFLQIIDAQRGVLDITEGGWADAFAEDYEKRDPATIQRCVDAGLITTSFNDLFETSTAYLTDKGREALSTPNASRGGDSGDAIEEAAQLIGDRIEEMFPVTVPASWATGLACALAEDVFNASNGVSEGWRPAGKMLRRLATKFVRRNGTYLSATR